MKKILSIILIFCLGVGLLLTITACNPEDSDNTTPHVHEYVNGTCACGETTITDNNYNPPCEEPEDNDDEKLPEEDNNTNKGEENEELPQKTPEQIWNDAFLLDSNFTAKLTSTTTDEVVTSYYKRADNLFESYDRTLKSGNETTSPSIYWELLDNASYKYESEEEIYEKREVVSTIESLMNEIYVKLIYGGTGSNLTGKSNYTYDSTNDQYTSESIICSQNIAGMTLSSTYSNVVLKLDNHNRLQSIICDASVELNSGVPNADSSIDHFQIELIITYDDTIITLPTI